MQSIQSAGKRATRGKRGKTCNRWPWKARENAQPVESAGKHATDTRCALKSSHACFAFASDWFINSKSSSIGCTEQVARNLRKRKTKPYTKFQSTVVMIKKKLLFYTVGPARYHEPRSADPGVRLASSAQPCSWLVWWRRWRAVEWVQRPTGQGPTAGQIHPVLAATVLKVIIDLAFLILASTVKGNV